MLENITVSVCCLGDSEMKLGSEAFKQTEASCFTC